MPNKTKAVEPLNIAEDNLSRAWSKAFLHIIDHAGKEIPTLNLTITGFNAEGIPQEDPAVRAALDVALEHEEEYDIETVAFTIFPQRLWQLADGDRKELFALYRMGFPYYQDSNRGLNGRGLYFERLVNFDAFTPTAGNQLEFILNQFSKRTGVRRSMFQAAVFDPRRDHETTALVPFPCLQHVSFVPTSAGLVVNAFYATQLIFQKAYGNYLGLIQLGAFMAHEMKMPLERLNVMTGIEKLEKTAKSSATLEPVIAAARACVMTSSGSSDASTMSVQLAAA